MSETELAIEARYRVAERLGILCGKEAPNAEAYEIARAEAEAWLASQRGEFHWEKE